METRRTVYNKNGIYMEEITNPFAVFFEASFTFFDKVEQRERERTLNGDTQAALMSDIKYVRGNA